MDKGVEIEILSALVGENAADYWDFGDRLSEFHFEYEPVKILFKLLKSHWKRSQATPSPGELRTYIRLLRPTRGPDICDLMDKDLDFIYAKERASTKDFIAEFIAGREINAFSREIDNLEMGNYRDYVKNLSERLDKLHNLEGHKETHPGLDPFSHSFLKDWSRKIKESYGGVPIGTGFHRFDDIIDPLYPGELGLFIAPTGKGKSVWLSNLAWYACNDLRLRVLYFALDNLAAEFAERLLTRATGIYIKGARRKYPEEVVDRKVTEKFYEVTNGEELRLHIRDFPRNTVSVRDIRAYIKSKRKAWIKEDKKAGLPEKDWGKVGLIAMDYGDLMVLENPSGQDWLDREKLYNNLTALGAEELCPVWTVSQTNTKGMEERAQGQIKEYHAAGGGSKLSPVRIGLSLMQAPEEKLKGIFSVYVWKATRSESGIVFPMKINYKKQLITERLDLDPYVLAGGIISNHEENTEENHDEFREERNIDPDIFSGVTEHFRSE